MAWRVFRITKAEAGPPFLKVTAERVQTEREILYPLFVIISDKRAILDYYARADQPYVTESIRHLRHELTETLTRLGPDAAAAPLLARIRTGIHEYLTAVDQAPTEPDH